MSTRPCSRSKHAPRRRDRDARAWRAAALATLLLATPLAQALSTDRAKPMDVTAAYSKVTQGSDKAPGVAYLRGNVRIVQGTMKANGAEATVHQHPDGAKDAHGKDISGSVQRVVLVGKKAHIEQQQDGGGVITADADNIDYNADTSVAVLTGGVVVVQPGRGTFNGEHMTYNTNTGEMESVDNASHQPVHMTFEPKQKAGAADAKKPDAKPADKPADAAAAKPAAKKSGKKSKAKTTTPPPATGTS